MPKNLFAHRWFRFTLSGLAVIGMVALAGYQRRTGPTWPISVDEKMAAGEISGSLPRSHGGGGGAEIVLEASPGIDAEIRWRRYPTKDEWQQLAFDRRGSELRAELPHQPPAGKLEYSVRLLASGEAILLPATEAAVIRFRADVPAWILIPHILCMFIALAIVLRGALGALLGEANTGRFAPWVLGFLIPGGFVLGPLVQKFAFGEYWTGWPFGTDWTDNKTLAALLAWVLVLVVRKWRPGLARPAVLLAAVVMMAVYLIPHSIHGSELDWSERAPSVGDSSAVAAPAAAAREILGDPSADQSHRQEGDETAGQE